jgi:hypothetical protein
MQQHRHDLHKTVVAEDIDADGGAGRLERAAACFAT